MTDHDALRGKMLVAFHDAYCLPDFDHALHDPNHTFEERGLDAALAVLAEALEERAKEEERRPDDGQGVNWIDGVAEGFRASARLLRGEAAE